MALTRDQVLANLAKARAAKTSNAAVARRAKRKSKTGSVLTAKVAKRNAKKAAKKAAVAASKKPVPPSKQKVKSLHGSDLEEKMKKGPKAKGGQVDERFEEAKKDNVRDKTPPKNQQDLERRQREAMESGNRRRLPTPQKVVAKKNPKSGEAKREAIAAQKKQQADKRRAINERRQGFRISAGPTLATFT
jgi:hypothetical protein